MIQKHSNDVEIQQFVFNPKQCDSATVLHINTCEVCQKTAQQYQLLFSDVEKQPIAAFDFDVSDLIIPKLKPRQRLVFNFVPVFISFIALVAGLALVGYGQHFNFKEFISDLTNVQWISKIPMAYQLIIVTTLLVLFFVIIDIRKNFKKKWQMLSTY